jgi:hypothetical protein
MTPEICTCGHDKHFHIDGKGCWKGRMFGIQNRHNCLCKKFTPKENNPQTKPYIQNKGKDELIPQPNKYSGGSDKLKTADIFIRLNDVLGLFKNRKKFKLRLEDRKRIMEYIDRIPRYNPQVSSADDRRVSPAQKAVIKQGSSADKKPSGISLPSNEGLSGGDFEKSQDVKFQIEGKDASLKEVRDYVDNSINEDLVEKHRAGNPRYEQEELVRKILKEVDYFYDLEMDSESFDTNWTIPKILQKALKMGWDKKAEEDLKILDNWKKKFNLLPLNFQWSNETLLEYLEELKQKISEGKA